MTTNTDQTVTGKKNFTTNPSFKNFYVTDSSTPVVDNGWLFTGRSDANNDYLEIKDFSGTQRFYLLHKIASSTINTAYLTMDLYTFGSVTTTTNFISSNLAGSGTRATCATAGGTITVTGCPTSSGANTTLSNLTAPTAINQHLKFDTDNAYYIGEASGATRIAPNTIYASTEIESPKFRVTYASGGSVLSWYDIRGVATDAFQIQNAVGDARLYFSEFSSLPIWSIHGDFRPDVDNTYDLGYQSGFTYARWRNLWLSGLAGTGTRGVCVTSVGLLSVTGCPTSSGVTSITFNTPLTGGTITTTGSVGIQDAAADNSTKGAASFTSTDFNSSSGNISLDYVNGQSATSSLKGFLTAADWSTFNNKCSTSACANTTLSNLGTTAINASLLFNSNNAYNIGSSATSANSIYAYTHMQSQQFRITKMSGTSVADYFDWRADSGLLELRNSSNAQIFSYVSATTQFYFKGHILPYFNNSNDLGATGAAYRDGYFAGTLTTGPVVATIYDIAGGYYGQDYTLNTSVACTIYVKGGIIYSKLGC
jgi:hypothetical protein